MTLPSSGPISMSQVAAELGISATGLSLNDSRVRGLAGVPSGGYGMNALYGKSANSVVNPLPSISSVSDVPQGGTAQADVSFFSNGSMSWTGGSGQWYSSIVTGIGSSYWIRLTLNSGSVPTSGSTGVWISLASTVTWSWVRSITGTRAFTGTIQIATDSAGTNIVSSGSVSATATVEP